MAKVFRPSNREASILSKIESSKEYARRQTINKLRDVVEPLANAIAMKLVESKLVETTNKNSLEEQVAGCLEKLTRSEDFDIDYQIAPFRAIIERPNIVSIYVTAFILETMINHKDVVDIYGSDEEVYYCINRVVIKQLV